MNFFEKYAPNNIFTQEYAQTVYNSCYFNTNMCCSKVYDYQTQMNSNIKAKNASSKRGKTPSNQPIMVQMTILNDESNSVIDKILYQSNNESFLNYYIEERRSQEFSLRKFILEHDVNISMMSTHKIESANQMGLNLSKTIKYPFIIKPAKRFSSWAPPLNEIIFQLDLVQSTASSEFETQENVAKNGKSPCPIHNIIPINENSNKTFHNMFFACEPYVSNFDEEENCWSFKICIQDSSKKINFTEGCCHMFRFTCLHIKDGQKTELFTKFSSPFKSTSKSLSNQKFEDKIAAMIHKNICKDNFSHSGCTHCNTMIFDDSCNRLRDMHHFSTCNMKAQTIIQNKDQLVCVEMQKSYIKDYFGNIIELNTIKQLIDLFFDFKKFTPLEPKEYITDSRFTIYDLISKQVCKTMETYFPHPNESILFSENRLIQQSTSILQTSTNDDFTTNNLENNTFDYSWLNVRNMIDNTFEPMIDPVSNGSNESNESNDLTDCFNTILMENPSFQFNNCSETNQFASSEEYSLENISIEIENLLSVKNNVEDDSSSDVDNTDDVDEDNAFSQISFERDDTTFIEETTITQEETLDFCEKEFKKPIITQYIEKRQYLEKVDKINASKKRDISSLKVNTNVHQMQNIEVITPDDSKSKVDQMIDELEPSSKKFKKNDGSVLITTTTTTTTTKTITKTKKTTRKKWKSFEKFASNLCRKK